jgi:hypothetical protein
MTLRAIDTVLTQQALIVGQVTDSPTGRRTRQTPVVRLLYQTAPGEKEQSYPLVARIDPNGLYVFAGDPVQAFPQLEGGETLDLRLQVEAGGYQERTIDFSLSAADLALNERVLSLEGRSVAVAVLAAPLLEHEIALEPTPVHLAGRVVRADEPDIPVANAQVSVIAPESRGPAPSDENGFYTLQDLPVASSVTVRVAREPEYQVLDETVIPDYGQALNQRTFVLTPTT